MQDKQHIALEVSKDEHYRSPYLKSLKENWPSLARDYRHYCHVTNPQLGDVWTWTSPEGQKFFHLVLDEKEHGQHVDAHRLKCFKKAIKKIKRIAEDEDLKTIELPKVGFNFTNDELDLAKLMITETFMGLGTEIKFV